MTKKKLNDQGLSEDEFLNQYSPGNYERPSVTADVLVFTVDNIKSNNYKMNDEKVLKLLLINRINHPFINCWAIPGGFVNIDEGLHAAALRELKEETNIEDVYIEQLYTFGQVDRDPRTRVISTTYMALVDQSKLHPVAGDDAKDVKWFEISRKNIEETIIEETETGIIKTQVVKLSLHNDEVGESVYAILKITETLVEKNIQRIVEILEQKNIAFDHAKVIYMALDRLKNKVEYTQIAFNLVPEYFTLTELQKVYQVILGKEEKPAGFRRKIMGMVVESDKIQSSKGHRPAKLFTYNKKWHL